MIGLAGLVQVRLPTDHAVQQDLQRLMEAGEQAAHLAGQMLAFSKQRKPAPQAIDLNTIALHSLKLFKGTMPADIQLCQHFEAETLLVHADETQLKQVVMNLCLNAREAMEAGGTLTVSTAKITDVSSAWPGWANLAVQATGPGRAPA